MNAPSSVPPFDSRRSFRLLLALSLGGLLVLGAGWFFLREDHARTDLSTPPGTLPVPAGLVAESPDEARRMTVIARPRYGAETSDSGEPPPSQDVLWRRPAPEPPFAAFQTWAEKYGSLSGAERAAAEAEGVRLASERRTALTALIKSDPRRALELAVPETVRRSLPTAVAAQLEKRLDGRGDLLVDGYGPPLPGLAADYDPVSREAVLGGEKFAAYVYGRREFEPSRQDIPLHGIAVGKRAAFSEWPGRVLEPLEREEARRTLAAEPVCPTSKEPTREMETETAIQSGQTFDFFCMPAHALHDLREAAAGESARPPGFGARSNAPVTAAGDGDGSTVPSFAADGDPAWTTGQKSIAIVRVTFNGTAYQNYSVADCEEVLGGFGEAWSDWSYGRCGVKPTGPNGSFITPVLNLPHSANYYDAMDDDEDDDAISDIYSLAVAWAMLQGRPSWTYDRMMILAGGAPVRDDEGDVVGWGGVGQIPGKFTFMRTTQADIIYTIALGLHELGHNFGFYHSSNLWTTPQQTDVDPTYGIPIYKFGGEYGDRYCRMGAGGPDAYMPSEYNTRFKNWMHWLDDANVPLAVDDGRFTIREHDLQEKSGVRGLQIPFGLTEAVLGQQSSLYVEYRLHDPANPLLAYGAQIRLQKAGSPKGWLLDATPETPNHEPDEDLSGNLDSPLLPGRTFSYTKYGVTVHITNIEADPDAGKLELHVEHGTPSGNDPPNGSIQFWTPQGAVNQKVYFTAAATDPEGDELAYHWQIAGHGPYDNVPTVSATFTTTGQKTIKCLVSDMHGGVRTLTASFQVLANQPPSISTITDRIMPEDSTLTNIPFTVSDPTSEPSTLTVTATSDNILLFPASGLTLSSAGGGNRRITLSPAANKHGTAIITLQVSDGVLKDTTQFEVTVEPVTPGTPLFSSGSTWRYWDDTAVPPGGWKNHGYNDSSWKTGPTTFLYNQGLVPPGDTALIAPGPGGRVTTYYRRTVTIPAVPTGALTLRLLVDDGAVVYLNGTEVWRQNAGLGTLRSTDKAESSVEGVDEKKWTVVPLENSMFNLGTANTLAVEVHDAVSGARGAGDVTFDCTLAMLQAPVVSPITDKTSPEDTQAGPYSFTASEAEFPAAPLELTAVSSNQALVRDADIKFGTVIMTGAKTVFMTPRPNATGTTLITVKVSDGGSATWRSFNLTVTPVSDPPTIAPLPPLTVALGEIPPVVELQVDDIDTDPATLVLTPITGNAALVPASGLQILPGSHPRQRWLRIVPTPGATGNALVTVRVQDGPLLASSAFLFRVTAAQSVTATDISLINSGEQWRYLAPDPRAGEPAGFEDLSFDDRAWSTGRDQLGYGDGDETTVIPATPLRVTTYFRRTFTVQNAAQIASLKFRMIRDDGAVVYLNGTQIWSSNMPARPDSDTLASSDVSGAAESTWFTSNESAALLRNGTNVVAVEVHQSVMPAALAPGDLSFDLELDGVPAPATFGEDPLIAPGSPWSYWDQASYPDDTWRTATFGEDDWNTGAARLGYGVGGESTLVNDDNAQGTGRNPSVLFRKVFDVADPGAYAALHLILQRDDGIAVHLNGSRVLLDNLDSAATPGHFALKPVPDAARLSWHHYLIDRTRLIPGRNLIAVEVHQASATETDLVFDLQLTGVLATDMPPLFLRQTGPGYEVSWPSCYKGWNLRASPGLDAAGWSPVSEPILPDRGWNYIQLPGTLNRRFFRLVK